MFYAGNKQKTKYLSNVNDEAFVADLIRGKTYTISIDAVDHVGNLLVNGAKYSVDVPLGKSVNGLCFIGPETNLFNPEI